ncbi:MAG TPA: hypothetical protein VED41_08800 [Solirubrobacteraceae bacterium]|nr:hypothetical protein [Solirubrobacteraceae bacterium]
MPSALGLALSALVWLAPPSVLPLSSRTGPEGPPRPVSATPPFGTEPPATSYASVRAQNRALLEGPFPSGGLERGVSDGVLLLSEDAAVRELTVSRIRASGARLARIPVDWREVVSEQPGPGFDAADPASPEYHFALIDAAVRSAVSAGLEPLLVVSHAPAFAESAPRWRFAYPGSWDPSPEALRAFATALASRYDGSFPDPSDPSRPLPRVSLFQAWNEPNLARYLEPQWVAEYGRWQAFSPLVYRELLNGFYAGIKAVEPRDTVITAGVAPNGEPAGVGRMTPVQFLRSLLCLTPATIPGSGGCPDPPHFDALDFHPLSVGNPDVPAPSLPEVSIADAAKITTLLARAERAHTALPAGEKQVWVTELNWESAPQSPQGVPPRLQALWVSRALHRLWVAGVSVVAWQFLIDPFPGARVGTPTGGIVEVPRPAGLYAAGADGNPAEATPKPFLQGFTLPFDPLRVNAASVRAWALLMGPREPALLQRQLRDGAWRTVARLRADGAGVLNQLVVLRGGAALRLVSGGLTSGVASVPVGRSRL